jgi:hypothetical protein
LQRVIATICNIIRRTSISTNSATTFSAWSEFSTKKILFL